MNDCVRFNIFKKDETNKNILIEHAGIEVWLPKSRIRINKEIDCVGGIKMYEITMLKWMAKMIWKES